MSEDLQFKNFRRTVITVKRRKGKRGETKRWGGGHSEEGSELESVRRVGNIKEATQCILAHDEFVCFSEFVSHSMDCMAN